MSHRPASSPAPSESGAHPSTSTVFEVAPIFRDVRELGVFEMAEVHEGRKVNRSPVLLRLLNRDGHLHHTVAHVGHVSFVRDVVHRRLLFSLGPCAFTDVQSFRCPRAFLFGNTPH